MGRKYASLHIRFANVDKESFFQTYKRLTKPMFPMDVAYAAQKLGVSLDEKEMPLLDVIMGKYETTDSNIQLKEHNGFISIYDKQLSFESIEDVALRLSIELSAEVLFASVYDDDVFFFGLYQNGLSVAEHVSGQCEAYGMEKAQKNIEFMEKYLRRDTDIKLVLQNKEGVDFETVLQKYLGFSLCE